MVNDHFDVLGIGNAIVDILAQAEDDFLRREAIHKGTMTLVDAARAEALFERMGPTTTVSGGSAANTIAGLASLGGRTAYIGKVHDDQLGAVFSHDMKAMGVHFRTPLSLEGAPTACCMILVTPDGQRSMNTFLGACVDLGPADVDEEVVAAAKVTYLEGYLFDKPPAKEAFRLATRFARQHNRKVALSLSDPFCVDRHRADFRTLIRDAVDIVFANEAEATALYEKNTLDEAMALLAQECELAIVTRGENGSVILRKGERIAIAAEKPRQLLDTTGAGDLYAAGFLFGFTHGLDVKLCGRIASLCAAEVIAHLGPRPQTNLRQLVETKLGVSL